jgi:tRNA (cytidine/uridine-2'-O-)-methyltransferase
MVHVVLYEPEIPPNTGNIIRLCANTGSALHLIRPLGFELDDRRLRRAGLDYREFAAVTVHDSLQGFVSVTRPDRCWALSTRGRRHFHTACFRKRDAFLFGPETRGLPETVLQMLGEENVLRLPMVPGSRSLNLANTVAVVVYEAWRQAGFDGAG